MHTAVAGKQNMTSVRWLRKSLHHISDSLVVKSVLSLRGEVSQHPRTMAASGHLGKDFTNSRG